MCFVGESPAPIVKRFFVLLLIATSALAQKKPSIDPITSLNLRWTTYQNGWADLSFSLHNNTQEDVKNVKYRIVFYDRNREPIHYEDGTIQEIPAKLSVQRVHKILLGGVSLKESTASIKVVIRSFEKEGQ